MSKIVRSTLTDTLEICDSKGKTVAEIPYTINVGAIYDAVQHNRARLMDIAKNSGENTEAIGLAFGDLLDTVFGKDVAEQIAEAYTFGGVLDAVALVNDLTPLLVNDIFPAFEAVRRQMIETRKKAKRTWVGLKRA